MIDTPRLISNFGRYVLNQIVLNSNKRNLDEEYCILLINASIIHDDVVENSVSDEYISYMEDKLNLIIGLNPHIAIKKI